MDKARQYVKDVLDEKIVTNKYIKLACERFNEGLNNQRKSFFPFYFDEEKAQRIINFFPYLRHWKGVSAGKPIDLENWQAFYLADLFGWMRQDGDIRKYSSSDLWVARKNGKTTLAAGLGIFGLTKDGVQGPQIYTVATTADQASICFNDAKKIIDRSPALARRIKTLRYSITNDFNDGIFKYFAAKSTNMDGFDPSHTIADEIHAHKTSEVVDVMKSGMGARQEPLMIKTSTAGFRSYAYGYSQFDYSQKVLEGVYENESWHALVYCLDEGDDWKDESVWIKGNPNLGVSKTWNFMRDEFQEAKNSLDKEKDFKTKQLNFWEQTEGGFISLEKIDRCRTRQLELADFKGRECIAGFDKGEVSDFSSFGLLGLPNNDQEKYLFKCWHWLPIDGFSDRVNYDMLKKWQVEGFIQLTPGFICDMNQMTTEIKEIVDAIELKQDEPIVFDPSRSREIQKNLHDKGIETAEMQQTMRFVAPGIDFLEELILNEKIEFGLDPVTRWMWSNVQVYTASNNAKRFVKKSGQKDDKVDDCIVASMVCARANLINENLQEYIGDPIFI